MEVLELSVCSYAGQHNSHSDNVAFSYPCEMDTLQAGWVTMVCSVHF